MMLRLLFLRSLVVRIYCLVEGGAIYILYVLYPLSFLKSCALSNSVVCLTKFGG